MVGRDDDDESIAAGSEISDAASWETVNDDEMEVLEDSREVCFFFHLYCDRYHVSTCFKLYFPNLAKFGCFHGLANFSHCLYVHMYSGAMHLILSGCLIFQFNYAIL